MCPYGIYLTSLSFHFFTCEMVIVKLPQGLWEFHDVKNMKMLISYPVCGQLASLLSFLLPCLHYLSPNPIILGRKSRINDFSECVGISLTWHHDIAQWNVYPKGICFKLLEQMRLYRRSSCAGSRRKNTGEHGVSTLPTSGARFLLLFLTYSSWLNKEWKWSIPFLLIRHQRACFKL